MLPIKSTKSDDFSKSFDVAINELYEHIGPERFKEFEGLLNSEVSKVLLESGESSSSSLLSVKLRFASLIAALIKNNLSDAFVELYSFSGTIPAFGLVLSIYAYEKYIEDVFKDYDVLHNVVRGFKYYLTESCYSERANCGRDWPSNYIEFKANNNIVPIVLSRASSRLPLISAIRFG